jgi:citronellyl-CoA synthetase
VNEYIRVIKDFLPILPAVLYQPPKESKKESLGRLFQETAARYTDRTAIIFEGRVLSWGQFNALANQYAHLLKKQGIQRGDSVALIMENRIEMLACIIAVAKLGAATGLINTSLTGRPLIHCITTTESKKCIVGEELLGSIVEVKDELGLADADFLWVKDLGKAACPEWACDLGAGLEKMPTSNLPETLDISAGEKGLYVFTSGTTGLPKAAVILHRRFLSAAEPYARIGFRAKPEDRLYLCLPLYHFTGLGPGVGACFYSGASIFLRRKFSASKFWPEVQQHKTNMFVYVGELCRYLAGQPESAAEKNNPLETMVGNGLRPDVWDAFRHRFGVKRISEMYGSSEGNAIFINLLNKDSTIGTTSAKVMLVQYDVDADEIVRSPKGKMLEVKKGEAGLLLTKIDNRFKFDGYKDKAASASKVLCDVVKSGDRWFNTGDLVRQMDVGFALGLAHYQFVDRVGDTFRWRSENVSTNEVGEILNGNEQVEVANVYGVEIPGIEGKAGMAALTLKEGVNFDAATFSPYVCGQLAAFARPVFVRIQSEVETTVTFKLFKGNLRKDAYHINQIDDLIYVLKPGSAVYEPLDADFYQKIVDGKSGY